MNDGPRPYDIVHVVHGTFPEDPRVRRETAVAAGVTDRVLVIALRQLNCPHVGRHGRIRILRLAGGKSRGSALAYLREYASFTIRVFMVFSRVGRLRHARVVHVHTLPDFLVFGTLPAIRRGARSILDMHEIFPEFVRSRFPGAFGSVAAATARLLERASRARATITITVNEPIRRLLQRRSARRDERIEIVHNLADPNEMGVPAPRRHSLDGPTRLVYHGTLTDLYGLDIAIDAISLARRSDVGVTLDIFGDGPSRGGLEAQVKLLGIAESVRFHGSVPHTTLRDALPTFDGGLIPTRLDAMTRFSLSTKLLELFHLGIPVIAARIPAYQAYFSEECAWYFTPNDAASAAGTIIAFVAAADVTRQSRADAARRVTASLQWSSDAARLAALYDELLAAVPR